MKWKIAADMITAALPILLVGIWMPNRLLRKLLIASALSVMIYATVAPWVTT